MSRRRIPQQAKRIKFGPQDDRILPLCWQHDFFSAYAADPVERLVAMFGDWQDPDVRRLVHLRFLELKADGRCRGLDEPWAATEFRDRTLAELLKELEADYS